MKLFCFWEKIQFMFLRAFMVHKKAFKLVLLAFCPSCLMTKHLF